MLVVVREQQTHLVRVICTDAVASAITLIMQSTVVFTSVHMTGKGSTIDPEGSNTRLQSASLTKNKSMENLPCNKYRFFFLILFFFLLLSFYCFICWMVL